MYCSFSLFLASANFLGISAAIILLTFKAPASSIPEKTTFKHKMVQIDFPGTFLIMAAIICYVLAFQVCDLPRN